MKGYLYTVVAAVGLSALSAMVSCSRESGLTLNDQTDSLSYVVGMNTSNGAQAQIWNFVAGGNQEWTLERIDPDTAQSGRRAEEAKDPQPTPSQRKHQNDLVRKLNNAGKGRASRKGQ